MHKEKNVQTGLTTPLALKLYQTLAPKKKSNADYLVMEITSHKFNFSKWVIQRS